MGGNGRAERTPEAKRPSSAPLCLPIHNLQRAVALAGDKSTIDLLATLLDQRQVAGLWHVSPDFVKDAARRGLLPVVRLGRLKRFKLLDVLRYIEQHASRHPSETRALTG